MTKVRLGLLGCGTVGGSLVTLLRDRGVDPGPIDGDIGRKTIAAIREFQGSFMRRPDGRVDPNGRTFRELLGL